MESIADIIICPDKKGDISKNQFVSSNYCKKNWQIWENVLKSKVFSFKFYSLTMDENIKAIDTAQFAISISF